MSEKLELTVGMIDGCTGCKDSDLFYSEQLYSSNGMHFTLFKQDHHTSEDVKKAKKWLRNNRDVCGIQTIDVI